MSYAATDVAPNALAFLAACAACIAPWWMPGSWYRTRAFERSGRFYEALGVRWFRKLVPNGDWVNAWRRRFDPSFRVVANRRAATDYVPRTIVGEKSPLVLFCIGVASALYAWHIGWHGWAAYLAAANILSNLYPIILQRYTRARLDRLASRRIA